MQEFYTLKKPFHRNTAAGGKRENHAPQSPAPNFSHFIPERHRPANEKNNYIGRITIRNSIFHREKPPAE